jgi:hypothetical protein
LKKSQKLWLHHHHLHHHHKKKPESPVEIAKALRAQAARARLEAERMDAELTLEKIEKLERELVRAKTKGDSVEDLQRQLDNLQAKLRGEPPKPVVAPKPTESKKVETAVKAISNVDIYSPSTPSTIFPNARSNLINLEFSDLNATMKFVEDSPGFIKKLLASLLEMDYDTMSDLNSTELGIRVNMLTQGDYSYSSLGKPTFTQEEIGEAVKKIDSKSSDLSYPSKFAGLAGGNVTKLAEYALEFDYYLTSKIGSDEQALQLITKIGQGEEWMQVLLEGINQTDVDRTIETLYPKCTRKEGGEPTLPQVQSLVTNLLPSAKFSSTSKPEKVLGGYVIRGNHKYENGDDLIAAIDKEMAKSSLGDKMTVLYAPDFTIFAKVEQDDFDLDLFDPEELPPVLYVTGPDIVRERQRVLLSLTSALALATSWYLSISPFLLNPTLAKRIEDQLAIADTGMAYDLEWLTDLSIPLFLTFIAIQIAHEVAHLVVASIYDMKLSVPTFVPSIVTGTTSTVKCQV